MSSSRPTVSPISLPELSPGAGAGRTPEIEAIAHVTFEVSVVAGFARLSLGELDALRPGSVVTLDRGPEAAADLFVNGVRAGSGDVIVLDDHLAARVAEVGPPERQ